MKINKELESIFEAVLNHSKKLRFKEGRRRDRELRKYFPSDYDSETGLHYETNRPYDPSCYADDSPYDSETGLHSETDMPYDPNCYI